MRTAFVSDLHSNAQAWNSVLSDIGSIGCDRIVCLGDLVGYGPSPVAVLESAHQHIHSFVLGNHDAVVAGLMTPENFNDRARRMTEWTRARLGAEGVRFLSRLPLSLKGPDLRCTHANFARPSAFDYILDANDAAASWAAVPEQLLFVGHTHQPALFVLGASGTPHAVVPQDFSVERGKRYIVNVGSVGLPRDGDARASYVIYDDVSGTVRFRRVPFDFDAFERDVRAAGLSPSDVPLLRNDPRKKMPSLREQIDFAPARRREDEAAAAVAEAGINETLRRSVSRWKKIAIVAGTALLLAAAGAGAALRRIADSVPRVSFCDPAEVSIRHALPGKSLTEEFPGFLGSDGSVASWGLVLGGGKRQSVSPVDTDVSGVRRTALRLESRDKSAMVLTSPSFTIPDDLRGPSLRLEGFALPGEDFQGTYTLSLETLRADGAASFSPFETVSFIPPKKDSDVWYTAQRSFTGSKHIPKYAAAVRVVVVVQGTGTLTLPAPRLIFEP